jgi:hypothetical protein
MSTVLLDESTNIAKRFRQYHETNPQVYDTLVKLARQMKSLGHKHIGIKMLFEVVRWQMMLTTTDPSGYKLNNDYTSRYARLIMDSEPDLAGMFELRTLHAPNQ